jgi:hypothetical protein
VLRIIAFNEGLFTHGEGNQLADFTRIAFVEDRDFMIRREKETHTSGKKGAFLSSRGKRANTGNSLIQVSDGMEKSAIVKNELSLSEKQHRAASPSDC